ncbi:DUF6188 family protein [Streptomyces sp. NPDC002758]
MSAVAFKSGTLRLMFDSGMHLTCSADTSFEPWQIAGPRGRQHRCVKDLQSLATPV